MSNYIYLWGSAILPWFTLFFMKKKDIQRYMAVAMLGAVITSVVIETALALNWWIVTDSIFPFYHMPPYIYGAFPVGIIWIFRFTNKRFLRFMLVNAVLDYALAYPIFEFTVRRGIVAVPNPTSTSQYLFLIAIIVAAMLYVYQLWQESKVKSPRMKTDPFLPIIPDPAYKHSSDEIDKDK